MLKHISVLGAIAAVSFAGCSTRVVEREVVHAPAPQPVVVQAAPAPAPAPTPVIVATVQPPPQQVEKVPPAPSTDAVWIPGYWNYSNNQYVWVAGGMSPHAWVTRGSPIVGNTRMAAGRW